MEAGLVSPDERLQALQRAYREAHQIQEVRKAYTEELRRQGNLVLSASQLKTYQRCPRLWWFDKCRDMPRGEQSYSQTFGKVLHSVAERYLDGDASGRDSEGRPVNLYPEGWETDPESGERLLPQDEEVVQALISKAIEEGVLQRRPDLKVETHFLEPMTPGVYVQGFIDVDMPGEIQDHKSTKSIRYALSPEKLADDTQMLLYAKIRGAQRIRHNVFSREGRVKTVPKENKALTLDPEKVEKKWEELQALSIEMKALADMNLQDEDLQDVPAEFPSRACNQYGGCKFINLCAGTDEPAKYRRRKLKVINPQKTESAQPTPTIEAAPYPKPPMVAILQDVLHEKGSLGPVITLPDLLRRVVESEGSSLEEYRTKHAFDRRDALAQVAHKVVADLAPVVISARGNLDPDEKALLSALRPYSTLELVARAAG